MPQDISELTLLLATEISTLPRLSRVVERFLEDAGRDTARAEDFAAALELDPPLRDWVLRQANSGFYNLVRPVASVAQACVVMGLEPLSRLIFAACTRDLLQRPLVVYRYPGPGFWLHGLAVGIAARRLALRCPGATELGPEAALVAGLLHDTGKLLLDGKLPRAGGPRHVDTAEEIELYGVDHGGISAAIASQWKLPGTVIDAVVGHHSPQPTGGACIIAAADLLARHWGLGIWTYARLDLEPPLRELSELATPLGLATDDVASWCEELPTVMAGLVEMVQAMGHGGLPDLPGSQPPPAPPTPVSERSRRRRSGRDRQRKRGRDRQR